MPQEADSAIIFQRMTTLIIIVIAAIAAFSVSLISPKHGSRIQRFTDRVTEAIDSWLEGKPWLLRKLFGRPANISDKAIKKTASAGKKTHRKISS